MKLTILGELTDLNTHINSLKNNRYVGSKLKKEETERVYADALEQKLKPIKDYPVHIKFYWFSKDKRKDIDNVAFSKKFILDGLVWAKVLRGDGRKFISSFEDHFEIDKIRPRIEVEII